MEAQLGKIKDSDPKYSIWTKVKVLLLIKQVCVLVTIASTLALSPSLLLPLFLSLSPFSPSLPFSLSSPSLPPSLPLGARWFDAQHLLNGQTLVRHLNRHYADALATDFGDLSLQQQVAYVRMLYKVQCTYQNFLCRLMQCHATV